MSDKLTVKKHQGAWYVFCGPEIVSMGYDTREGAIGKRRVIAAIANVKVPA